MPIACPWAKCCAHNGKVNVGRCRTQFWTDNQSPLQLAADALCTPQKQAISNKMLSSPIRRGRHNIHKSCTSNQSHVLFETPLSNIISYEQPRITALNSCSAGSPGTPQLLGIPSVMQRTTSSSQRILSGLALGLKKKLAFEATQRLKTCEEDVITCDSLPNTTGLAFSTSW